MLLAIVLSLVFHDMQYGPQAALIAESFGPNIRYSGAGLGYQLASVIAGGPAPLIAAAILQHDRLQHRDQLVHHRLLRGAAMIALLLMPRRAVTGPRTEFESGHRTAVHGRGGRTSPVQRLNTLARVSGSDPVIRGLRGAPERRA